MKIYIAKVEYDYEGFTILGFFATQEAAQQACDEDVYEWADGTKTPCGDSHSVECYEVQG